MSNGSTQRLPITMKANGQRREAKQAPVRGASHHPLRRLGGSHKLRPAFADKVRRVRIGILQKPIGKGQRILCS
jgi:hypothetical protein